MPCSSIGVSDRAAVVIGKSAGGREIGLQDPHESGDLLPQVHGYDQPIVILCSEGYTSSLAAAALQDLGLHQATDLIGGYKAWARAGLPVQPAQAPEPHTTKHLAVGAPRPCPGHDGHRAAGTSLIRQGSSRRPANQRPPAGKQRSRTARP